MFDAIQSGCAERFLIYRFLEAERESGTGFSIEDVPGTPSSPQADLGSVLHQQRKIATICSGCPENQTSPIFSVPGVQEDLGEIRAPPGLVDVVLLEFHGSPTPYVTWLRYHRCRSRLSGLRLSAFTRRSCARVLSKH